MKRFKIAAILILLCITACLMTSCVEERISADITPNGGTVTIEYITTKENYDFIIDMLDDQELENIEFYTEDGVEYAKQTIKKSFTSLDEMSTYLDHLNDDSDEGLEDILDNVKITYDKSDKRLTVKGTVKIISDSSYCTSSVLILSFPGNVTDYNLGEKTDSKTVEIDMLEIWQSAKETSFTVTAEASKSYTLFFIIFGIVDVIIVAVIILILYKKKCARAAALASATAPSDSQPEQIEEVGTDAQAPVNDGTSDDPLTTDSATPSDENTNE